MLTQETTREGNTVVQKDQLDTDLAESTHRALCRTEPYSPSNDIIIANSLCMRISHIAGVENTLPKPTPLSIHLWVRLGHLLSSSVRTLSRQLTDIDNVVENKVLQRICDMTGIEVTTSSASISVASGVLLISSFQSGVPQPSWRKISSSRVPRYS